MTKHLTGTRKEWLAARLDLLAGDDPQESGIEIVAQPPGTKLRGITLLIFVLVCFGLRRELAEFHFSHILEALRSIPVTVRS